MTFTEANKRIETAVWALELKDRKFGRLDQEWNQECDGLEGVSILANYFGEAWEDTERRHVIENLEPEAFMNSRLALIEQYRRERAMRRYESKLAELQ